MAQAATNRPTRHANAEPVGNIARIEIDKLFGRYSYRLPATAHADLSKVLILYGDNGSGKTSILQAVFHLLSPARHEGHRTYIATLPFKKLVVHFSDGASVIARRTGETMVGPYQLEVARGPKPLSVTVPVDLDGKVPTTPETDKVLSPIEDALRALGTDIYFLSDDRQLTSDAIQSSVEGFEIDLGQVLLTRRRTTPEALEARSRDRLLVDAIGRAVNWIQQQILTASSAGEANVNSIYDEIIRGLLRPLQTGDVSQLADPGLLADRLEALAARSAPFVRFGMLSPLTFAALVTSIRKASPSRAGVLAQVLGPYLDGVEARMAALQPIADALAVFVDGVNSFYTDKHLSYDQRTGMSVSTDSQRLEPQSLSSGEKQLLLLYCNILSARDRRSIFIIDEPELSLNIKWQRRLVDALLRCTEGNRTQFLMATHSIELLASHTDHVVQLTSA